MEKNKFDYKSQNIYKNKTSNNKFEIKPIKPTIIRIKQEPTVKFEPKQVKLEPIQGMNSLFQLNDGEN